MTDAPDMTPVMLYRKGGKTRIWGELYTTQTVPAHVVEAELAQGWHTTPQLALKAGARPKRKAR